jgi:hypothetical protein
LLKAALGDLGVVAAMSCFAAMNTANSEAVIARIDARP